MHCSKTPSYDEVQKVKKPLKILRKFNFLKSIFDEKFHSKIENIDPAVFPVSS